MQALMKMDFNRKHGTLGNWKEILFQYLQSSCFLFASSFSRGFYIFKQPMKISSDMYSMYSGKRGQHVSIIVLAFPRLYPLPNRSPVLFELFLESVSTIFQARLKESPIASRHISQHVPAQVQVFSVHCGELSCYNQFSLQSEALLGQPNFP